MHITVSVKVFLYPPKNQTRADVTLSNSRPSILCGFLTLPEQGISSSMESQRSHFHDRQQCTVQETHLSKKPRRGKNRHVVLNVFYNPQVPEVLTIQSLSSSVIWDVQSNLASSVSFSWKQLGLPVKQLHTYNKVIVMVSRTPKAMRMIPITMITITMIMISTIVLTQKVTTLMAV